MGTANSKDERPVPYMDMIGNSKNEVDSWVLINKKRYQMNACRQSGGEICLENAEKGSLRISYEDVVVSEVITDNGSDGKKRERLVITVYPVIKKRRHFVQVVLTFYNRHIVEQANSYILRGIETRRAPHLPMLTCCKRRIMVIVNPFSGRKRALNLWKVYVMPILQTACIDYDLVTTNYKRHAIEIAKDLKLDKYDAVAVVSGDGLILEVISGFLMRRSRERALKMPLVHIPGGTSNGLAASICFQCNEPFPPRGAFCTEMALMVVQPRYLPLRISHVQTEHDGDKAMFMSLAWGLFADIDIGSERFRWAGMARLHMEAFLRVAQLPEVAHYKAKISYLPVREDTFKDLITLRYDLQREKYTKGHFDYASVENFTEYGPNEANSPNMFESADLVTMPPLSEPVDSNWMVIEGYFVYVCLTSISHLGSDIPYLPCARLDDEFLYLTYADWNSIKSRVHFAKMMLAIDDCSHLSYPFLQIIPVRACRVEPLECRGGHVTVDGEQITSGSAFQVVPTKYCATVIGRNERI